MKSIHVNVFFKIFHSCQCLFQDFLNFLQLFFFFQTWLLYGAVKHWHWTWIQTYCCMEWWNVDIEHEYGHTVVLSGETLTLSMNTDMLLYGVVKRRHWTWIRTYCCMEWWNADIEHEYGHTVVWSGETPTLSMNTDILLYGVPPLTLSMTMDILLYGVVKCWHWTWIRTYCREIDLVDIWW